MAVAKRTTPASNDKGMARDMSGIAETPGEKTVAAAVAKKTSAKKIIPANPERKPTSQGRRIRLAKAFARPLDKRFKKETFVRDRFTIPASEYAVLVDFKKRLAEQGVGVKKSELIRAGLLLLGELEENEVKALLEKLATCG